MMYTKNCKKINKLWFFENLKNTFEENILFEFIFCISKLLDSINLNLILIESE